MTIARWAVALLLGASTAVHAQVGPTVDATDETADAHEDEQSEDRLLVYAFVGEVITKFGSNNNLAYINAGEEDDSGIRRLAGLTFAYRFWEGKNQDHPGKHQLWLFGEARHSARNLERPCDAADPECAQAVPPGADPDDFFRIVHDADTLEWQGGVTFARLVNQNETALYAKATAGFIRAQGPVDDVVDNHFVGFGIEHETGPFEGSYLEAGWGRTDLYATKRSERAKLSAVLFYTPQVLRGDGDTQDSILSFFGQGMLDSDLGPGSDDVQILFGLMFDVRRLAGLIQKGRQ